jgi:hypothetical protein
VACASLRSIFVRDTRALPEAARDVGPFLAHVAGHDAAVVGQRERHRERAVAGEDPDLDAAPRTRELRQQRHELALVGADLHPGVLLLRRSRRAARRAPGARAPKWSTR